MSRWTIKNVWLRRFKTATNEIRAFYKDKEEQNEYHYKVKNRRMDLDAWNNERFPRSVTTKSWKKLFKKEKQYLKKDLTNKI